MEGGNVQYNLAPTCHKSFDLNHVGTNGCLPVNTKIRFSPMTPHWSPHMSHTEPDQKCSRGAGASHTAGSLKAPHF
jgi:hypothetical protein